MITIKRFEFNYFAECCYLLYDETREAVLIDCGAWRENEEEDLLRYVKDHDLTIKRYLCTHLHLDHIFGNAFVYHQFGLSPEAHQAETQLPSAQIQAQPFGLRMKMEEIPIGRYLADNETIPFGNSSLLALLVPGHSPGSLAFYHAKEKFVISGDVLFCGSIGRTDLWGGNQDVLVAAIKDKLLSLPDETTVYPGHGSQTSILGEKLNNPFLSHP